MISLAPFRYRNCLSEAGGPIKRIEQSRIDVMGRQQYHANAFLRDDLVRQRPSPSVYSQADGSGTSLSPQKARYKAVSEALERWAFQECTHTGDCERYGFGVDPTTNGMAAFPGVNAKVTRTHALLEAIERFCLIAWWEGLLNGIPVPEGENQVDGVEISHPCHDAVVAVLHRRSHDGIHCYGHAAGFSFREAFDRAIVELARSESVIRRYRRVFAESAWSSQPPEIFERRCLFFSTDLGYRYFQIARQRQMQGAIPSTRTVFDGEIPGPWSDYAHVWRVAFEPPSWHFLGKSEDYFFW
jgi:hypothetical protein